MKSTFLRLILLASALRLIYCSSDFYRLYNGINVKDTFTSHSLKTGQGSGDAACSISCSMFTKLNHTDGPCVGLKYDDLHNICNLFQGPVHRKKWLPGASSFYENTNLVHGYMNSHIVYEEYPRADDVSFVHFSDQDLYNEHGPITGFKTGGYNVVHGFQARYGDKWGPFHGINDGYIEMVYFSGNESSYLIDRVTMTYRTDPYIDSISFTTAAPDGRPSKNYGWVWANNQAIVFYQPGCILAYIEGAVVPNNYPSRLDPRFECS